MSMLNTSPPTEPAQSDLGRRMAEARSRRERADAGSRVRGVATWDPAAAAGISPRLMMLAIVFVGAILGLLAFDASRAPSRAQVAEAEEARIAEEVFVQPEIEVAAPSAPDPSDAIADYYLLLRQSMYDVAWSRTSAEFQGENYPGGYPDFVRFWTDRPEIEVLATEVENQGQEEARVVADLHDAGSDRTFRNSYRLRYDAASGFWKIVSITSAW